MIIMGKIKKLELTPNKKMPKGKALAAAVPVQIREAART